ncbi:MAG: hypothetical protein PHX85_02280 [Methanobacteriaceae archaeon]|nr:hypothetical protein [Methanobacteriaceae archaeon]
MKIKLDKVNCPDILKHETKKSVLAKFLLVLFLFIGYFIFIATKYGLEDGFLVAILSWSFFVLCTPIADAGFLLDFPLRLITRIRMLFSEIAVWVVAILLNFYAFFFYSEIYVKTDLLVFFRHILEQPFPFWAIIVVSCIGTFMSIQFGDELIDKAKHSERDLYKNKKHQFRLWTMIFIVILSVILYDFLLKQLGVELPV